MSFVLVFFSPFSIAITSLGGERANLGAFHTFVRFVLVWICQFPLPLGVLEGLRFVIVALPGLFSCLFYILKFRNDTNNVVYDNTKIIKMPCCATPTHPSCTYYMLYPRSRFKCCTRCKTILHNGQAAYVDFNHSRERMKIRKEYGISPRKLLPPIDINRFSSYY